MLVNLVGNDEDVIFYGEFSDKCKLFGCENFSAGVGGIAENKCFYSGSSHSGSKFVRIKTECRRNQRYINRFCSRKNGVCTVVFVEG